MGASSLVLPSAVAQASAPAPDTSASEVAEKPIAPLVPEPPARVYVGHDGAARLIEATRRGARFTSQGAAVVTAPREWSFGSRRVTYRWEEGSGVLPLRV